MAWRRVAHFALNAVSAPIWVVWCILLGLLVGAAVLGGIIWPNACCGNCWAYALRQWALHGGSIAVVPSGVWLGPVPVLHVMWVPEGPVDGIEQAEPEQRLPRGAPWWRVVASVWYFRYRIVHDDRRHQRWRWRAKR